MNREFEGKKLLILGGNPETSALVRLANDMGIKTLVTSGRHTDDAKKYAWKSFDVDGMDVPGIIALARQEEVDGVLVGVDAAHGLHDRRRGEVLAGDELDVVALSLKLLLHDGKYLLVLISKVRKVHL